MDRKGSVLIHVLMTGVIVAVIAAGLMKMAMLRYTATARATGGAVARRQADAALSRALTYWNSTNIVCGDFPGYTCGGAGPSPGTCACTCTPGTVGEATIVVTGGGPPPCVINVNTVDPIP